MVATQAGAGADAQETEPLGELAPCGIELAADPVARRLVPVEGFVGSSPPRSPVHRAA